eukprot:snap_masked-scaffold_76-processed-gene-0.13-mRNA-1 protein AED:1.00 eAED:1.00 QI:0/0/0/0/1/1/2/0/92
MGSFIQFAKYMPYKPKAMVYSYLQRKLQRRNLAPLRGQFIDINSGKETRERFSLKELESGVVEFGEDISEGDLSARSKSNVKERFRTKEKGS